MWFFIVNGIYIWKYEGKWVKTSGSPYRKFVAMAWKSATVLTETGEIVYRIENAGVNG